MIHRVASLIAIQDEVSCLKAEKPLSASAWCKMMYVDRYTHINRPCWPFKYFSCHFAAKNRYTLFVVLRCLRQCSPSLCKRSLAVGVPSHRAPGDVIFSPNRKFPWKDCDLPWPPPRKVSYHQKLDLNKQIVLLKTERFHRATGPNGHVATHGWSQTGGIAPTCGRSMQLAVTDTYHLHNMVTRVLTNRKHVENMSFCCNFHQIFHG